MEEPERLAPCNNSNGIRRSCDPTHSPEFEFWMTRNPSFPQPNQLSADQLFSHGVLLPLDHLQCPGPEPSGSGRPETESGPDPSASIVNSSGERGSFTSSKRWKDIFKKTEKKDCNEEKKKEKEKRKEKKHVGGVSGTELNINIWPFSRSRSAGNGASRPRVISGSGLSTRKVSSAPCSRSNSAGESKSRKWPSSPSRSGGVHLGRSSPVWQVRTRNVGGPHKSIEGRRKVTSAPKARVLNLNVPMCIGYRDQLSCRSDENSAINVVAGGGGDGGDQSGSTVAGEGVRGSNLFSIKSLFTKKVY
ncbi:uncharacterized protein LOC132039268 [Lycium ferocissimum]|uniref:uncharacterized protein LOC132039268 n=1 Tax=Lycium ferocissimum TaxID=112874 RepID=UPI002814AE3E|nr:uncharacterized protein LOC132039268 [Lycium ferocissimum]